MTAFFVVVSLLFSQLALAGYVCPGTPDTEAMAEMMASGAPCEGMDLAQPLLCFQHAADLSLSFERQHPLPDPDFLATRRLRV